MSADSFGNISTSRAAAERADSADGNSSKSWIGEGTVLVVDDVPAVRMVFKRMLESFGFSTIMANDGADGLAKFMDNRPQIRFIVLDLSMPEMDGGEMLARVRRVSPDVPVILSSGYNEREIGDRLQGQRVNGFLQKPYRLAEVRALIQKVLAGH